VSGLPCAGAASEAHAQAAQCSNKHHKHNRADGVAVRDRRLHRQVTDVLGAERDGGAAPACRHTAGQRLQTAGREVISLLRMATTTFAGPTNGTF